MNFIEQRKQRRAEATDGYRMLLHAAAGNGGELTARDMERFDEIADRLRLSDEQIEQDFAIVKRNAELTLQPGEQESLQAEWDAARVALDQFDESVPATAYPVGCNNAQAEEVTAAHEEAKMAKAVARAQLEANESRLRSAMGVIRQKVNERDQISKQHPELFPTGKGNLN